jgi:hypothetical protein
LRHKTVKSLPSQQRDKRKRFSTMNNHIPLTHWLRQSDDAQRRFMNDRELVYQVSQIPKSDPACRPEVVAMTSKTSAQRLVAALASKESPYVYRISTFENPVIPGLEHAGIGR